MKTIIENIELNENLEGHFIVSMIFGDGKITEKIYSNIFEDKIQVNASSHREMQSAIAKYFRLRGFEVKIRKSRQGYYFCNISK